ncbi:MAG: VOC family protein [Nocardioidaceae bacterium]
MPLWTTKHWFGVVLDAPNARELANFYERLLGWRRFADEEDWATLAPSEDHGYNLSFQTEPNYVRPVWPSRPGEPLMMVHLDLEVDDLGAGVAYALECGAELPEFQPQERVRVMLDPAGHPFCLYLD